MIIGARAKLEIGRTYYGVTGLEPGSYFPDQPYVVVREATYEEWVEDCLKCDPGLDRKWLNHREGATYYEILTD